MRCFLCAVALLSLLGVPVIASAQSGGVIGIYADFTGYCLVIDRPGPVTLYVLQKFTTGATGSRFRLEFSPGFMGVLTSVSTPMGNYTGDPTTGLTLSYGSCLAGTLEILEVHLMLTGTSPECSWVRVAAHPSSVDGFPDTYDCIAVRRGTAWTGTHIQHRNDIFFSCPDLNTGENHNPPSCTPYTPTVAVDASTWGAVKALYK